MLITCPHCGARDRAEFTYGGDASVPRPELSDLDQERWADYVYLRTNPRGTLREFWHHVAGCRIWFIAERDTVSHKISATQALDDDGSAER
ncbi:MAG: sarcosine oxidase subunit delta [Alphaproteobacteria bacterium]|nr:sarcosine oxidase subunit delta [Alphaproteobacteria bacterium]